MSRLRELAGFSSLTLAAGCLAACRPSAEPAPQVKVEAQHSGTAVRLQAVSAVDADIVWASGLEGTFVRTRDGGATWEVGSVPGAETLQFRDVHAVDAETAYLLSSGPGEASRIYKTADGGTRWSLQFVNDVPDGFFDCFDFWDAEHGLAFSDSVDGELIIIRTDDGASWQRIDPERVPDAMPGEGGFAASGTCLVALNDSTAFIGTGVAAARVFKTEDRGASFHVVDVPIPIEGDASGITSFAFCDASNGIAAGGDISRPDTSTDNVVVTSDGGASWSRGGRPTFLGAVYGASCLAGDPSRLVVVGPGGASVSTDSGASWTFLSDESYWSVDYEPSGVGFMVGPEGRISRFH